MVEKGIVDLWGLTKVDFEVWFVWNEIQKFRVRVTRNV